MEHHFTGPSYTIGIEEELMICDARSFDLVNAIESLLERGWSPNSPFWRADSAGLASTRTPIFRAFPRVGIPPAYRDWDHYEREIQFMVDSGVMEDYTYLWYDVRPHPKFGTIEIRA